jgi:hypothetical protein
VWNYNAQELKRDDSGSAPSGSAQTVYSADFTFNSPPKYLDSVTLQFVTFSGPPIPVRAELDIGSCAASSQQMVIKDNEYRQFDIDRSCAAALGNSAGHFRVRLYVDQASDGSMPRIGIWTRKSTLNQVPKLPHISTLASETELAFITGNYDVLGAVQPWSKLKRLCWLWSPLLADYWIAVGVLLNLFLALGLFALYRLLSHAPAKLGAVRRALIAFCAVVGVSGAWAMLTPPFQAPDEPAHVLSYLHLVSAGVSDAPIADFAKRIHFERIKFNPLERFHTADTSAPFSIAWGGHVSVLDAPARSPAGAFIWRTFASISASWIAPMAAWLAEPGLLLLSLRIISLVVIGLAFAGSVAFMSAGKSWQSYDSPLAGSEWWSSLTWFMVLPNLAFFFVSVNTYTALFLGFAVFAPALCATESECAPRVQPRTPTQWLNVVAQFFVFLTGTAALLLGGKTGAVYCFVWLFLFLVAALRQRRNEGQWAALLFFSVIGPGVFWLTKAIFAGYELFGLAGATEFFWFWLLGGIPAGLCTLLICRYLNGKHPSPRIMTAVRLAAATALFLWFYASLIFVQDGLHNIEKDPSLPKLVYVWDALKSFFLSAAAGAPDYYTAETFWSPFGWLESMWHPAATKALQIVTLIGIVRMVAHWLTQSQALLGLLRLALFTGLIGALAYGLHSSSVNLHGRYLVGVYLIAFVYSAIGWTHLRQDIANVFQRRDWNQMYIPMYFPMMALAAGAAVQLYAVTFVFNRFF